MKTHTIKSPSPGGSSLRALFAGLRNPEGPTSAEWLRPREDFCRRNASGTARPVDCRN